jgi:PKD repeat protein
LNGGSNNQQSPVISGIDAPTSLTINQTGTWTVRATDPLNATLSYSVDWGDSNILPPGMVGNAVMQSFIQGTTFTHSYMNAGIYTVKVTVRNSGGLTAQIGSTVQVTGSNAAGPLRIISPNGGEVWQKGTTQTITWTSPYYFKATYADLKLVPYYQPCTGQICPMTAQSSGAQSSMMYPYRVPYTIVSGISINQNSYNWNVGAYIFNSGAVPGYTVEPVSFPIVAPDGQYTIQLCETGTSNCDSSDGYFNVISAGIPNLSQCPVGYTCTPNTY